MQHSHEAHRVAIKLQQARLCMRPRQLPHTCAGLLSQLLGAIEDCSGAKEQAGSAASQPERCPAGT